MIRAPHSVGNINQDTLVIDMARDVFFLDPESNVYTMLLNKFQKNRRKITSPIFRHLEGRLTDETTQINNGAGYLAADAAWVVDDASIFNVNDTLIVERTGAMALVTAVNTGTNTVTITHGSAAGVGEVAAADLVDNDVLRKVATAYTEGDGIETPNMPDFTDDHNLAQIFRKPYGVTKTAEETKHYYGTPLAKRRWQMGIEHALDIERAFMLGQRSVITETGNNPRRFTRGLIRAISAAGSGATVYDAGGQLYEDEFNQNFLEPISAKGGEDRWFFASARMISIMEGWGRVKQRLIDDQAASKKLGIRVRMYEGNHVRLHVFKHKLLKGNVYGYYGVAVEPDSARYAHLRDTRIERERQNPGDDQILEEYLTEAGFDYGPMEPNGMVINATS
jgi:hypothetical protein